MLDIEKPVEVTELEKNFLDGSFSEDRQKSSFKLGPLSLSVDQGETIVILGKNGSGKSTFFDILTGNSDPSSGTVKVFGERLSPDMFAIKKKIGYLPQTSMLPKWVTAREILQYAALLHDLDRSKVDEMIQIWDITSFKHKPLATCSHGMQKRVSIALSMLHDPLVLVMDEPFSGLDMIHMQCLEDEIKKRDAERKATVLSTHQAHYAAKLGARAFFLNEGSFMVVPNWTEKGLLERIEMIERLNKEKYGAK